MSFVEKRGRRGQVAIWIIFAIAIAVIIVLVFTLRPAPIEALPTALENPQGFIEDCAEDAAEEAIDLLLPQGGFIDPTNFKINNNIKVEYICQNPGFYRPCINQHPLLMDEIKQEIESYVQPRVEECFLDLEKRLEERGAQVTLSDVETKIDLAPDLAILSITGRTVITRGETTATFDEIESTLITPVYDLANVAREIALQEAITCYFSYDGFSVFYPRWNIKLDKMSDGTKIYTIIDLNSNKEMNIAIRGCAYPAGI